jgi:hypothetical protein
LRAAETAKVRQTLHSILSAPVFDPDNPDATPIATLQVDSDLPLEQTQYGQEEIQQLAERFADVVALLCQAAKD